MIGIQIIYGCIPIILQLIYYITLNNIIEHYGKVVIALAGVLAAVLLTAAVVTIVSDRTKGAVSDISYKEHIYDAIDASRPNQ